MTHLSPFSAKAYFPAGECSQRDLTSCHEEISVLVSHGYFLALLRKVLLDVCVCENGILGPEVWVWGIPSRVEPSVADAIVT